MSGGASTAPTPAVASACVPALAALVLAVAACGTTEPDTAVFVDVQLAVDTLATGDWTQITIRAGNAGATPVPLVGLPCFSLRYRVLDPDAVEVYPAGASWECGTFTMDGRPALQPEAIETMVHTWVAVHGHNVVGGSGEPLAPGTYRVIPSVVLADDTVAGDAMVLEIIE